MINERRVFRLNRKWVVTAMIAGITPLTALFSFHPAPVEKFTNLKVLPANIRPQELQKIMVEEFDDGLGVSCQFCHAEGKAGGDPDFASDAKPEKKIARSMMRMTIRMNKKYFNLKRPVISHPDLVVSCSTCHGGLPVPEKIKQQ